MSIRSGSISFARFMVTGYGGKSVPKSIEHSHLDALASNILNPSGIGEPKPIEVGWCGGRHIFDTDFSAETNAFGESLLFGLRVDTNNVPAEIKRAYRAMAETGYATDSSTGFISRKEKLAAKEDAEERCRQELASGKYRRSKCVDVLWDFSRSILLAPAFSDNVVAALRDLFMETFDLKLQPLTSGNLAFELLSDQGRTRDYEDLTPSVFTSPPVGITEGEDGGVAIDTTRPEVPWAHHATETNDFIGNEFLLWLWWRCQTTGGTIKTKASDVALAFDRSLDMECPWGIAGKQALQMNAPTGQPEAIAGLRNSKWPRKAGLIIATDGQQFDLSFQADRFQVTAFKVPRPEEDLKSQREVVEYRLSALESVDKALASLFSAFLTGRIDSSWTSHRSAISTWIQGKPQLLTEVKSPVVEMAAV